LEADIAKGVMSAPRHQGFEIGSGFAGTLLTGSGLAIEFIQMRMAEIRTRTNRSEWCPGKISNGENIIIRVAFKPTATIRKEQNTGITHQGRNNSSS
jgi:chorismate synthase